MMKNQNREIITNPANLALPYANISWGTTTLEASKFEKDTVSELVGASEIGQMHSTYFVDASNGYIFPKDAANGGWFAYTRYFRGLMFEGHFDSYGIVKIGQLDEVDTCVRALCLAFEQSILVTPQFVPVDQEDMLLVPVIAVNEMSKRVEN